MGALTVPDNAISINVDLVPYGTVRLLFALAGFRSFYALGT